MKTISGMLAALLVSAPLWGQIKVATITDENDPASKAVMDDLRSRLKDHPKQFTLVSTQDAEHASARFSYESHDSLHPIVMDLVKS